MRPHRVTWAIPDRDGIAAAQTLGAAGPLTINGALLDLDLFNRFGTRRALLGPSIERTVSLYSAGNLSGVDFTITGVDTHGQVVTESGLAGPNNSTVETTALFAIVTSIEADGAVGTNVEVGSGSSGTTGVWVPDYHLNPCNISLMVDVVGTVNWDIEHTADDVYAAGYKQSAGTWKNHADLAGETASGDGNYAFCPAGIRGVVNSSGADGALMFTFIQSGL